MRDTAAYQKIYRDMVDEIRSGKLGNGDKLPPETQLAENYGVSRITSRHAMTMLADEGYIVRVPGKGSLVAEQPKTIPAIGLTLSDFDTLFGTEFIKGVFHEAAALNHMVIMQTGYHVREQEGLYLRRLLSAGVKGIIDVPLYDSMHFTEELETVSEKIPLLFADRQVIGLNAPLVCTDNIGATMTLCRKLRENGYKKIAFISSKTDSTAVGERLKGYMNYCTADGGYVEKRLIMTSIRSVLPGMESKDNEAYDIGQIEAFLQENADVHAIIAHTYQVAKLVRCAIHNRGFAIPRDYAVMCFDAPRGSGNRDDFAHMRQNEYEIGVRSVKWMIDAIAGKPVPDITYVGAVFVDGNSYQKKTEHT